MSPLRLSKASTAIEGLFGGESGLSALGDAVVVVLRAHRHATSRVIGIVVDAVADVFDTCQADVGMTPEFGAGINTEFITGLASSGDDMIMLLDVDKLLNHPDISDPADVAET